ncbi:MAG: hypothetical protein ACI4F1_13295 [Bariatricus sp.]
MKPAYSRPRSENVRAIIAEIKSRKGMTDEDIAKLLGISVSSFRHKKASPGRFRLEDIWLFVQLSGADEAQKAGIL